MIETLVGSRDETACVCGVCARAALNVGVIERAGDQNILWLCDLCTGGLGLKVIDMDATRLAKIEEEAIAGAARDVAGAVAQNILAGLWAAGVRDLDSVSPEIYAAFLAALADDADYHAACRKLLTGYSNAVRRDLTIAK